MGSMRKLNLLSQIFFKIEEDLSIKCYNDTHFDFSQEINKSTKFR